MNAIRSMNPRSGRGWVAAAAAFAFLLVASRAEAHNGVEHVMGTLKSIDATSVTVATKDGKDVSIKITGDTKLEGAPAGVTLQDLKAGDRVVVHAKNSGDVLVAQTVKVGAGAAGTAKGHEHGHPRQGIDREDSMESEDEKVASRRQVLLAGGGGLLGGALLLAGAREAAAAATPAEKRPRAGSGPATGHGPAGPEADRPGRKHLDYRPVVIPNGAKVPWRLAGGAKVFHMVAEEVDHEFTKGLKAKCWGYNGRVHGPAIEAVEGDRVRIYVTNRLAAPTTVHWHGILLPNGMDGVGGLTQKAIPPGETFKYEFTLRQSGMGMYHSHHDEMTQIGMGMTGLFIIHPRTPRRKVDRDYAILLHEWRLDVGASRPNPNEMTEFNLLTMNARAFPGTQPLVAQKGDRVRIRIGNLSPMDHHPIHLHGYQFKITETDGGAIPESAQQPETTVLVPVGSTRTIEFVADEPGDWAMHCHMTHHVMNQMGHQFPNVIGVRQVADFDKRVRKLLPGYMSMGATGMGKMGDVGMQQPPNSVAMMGGPGKHDYITMGGMFTVLKVRDRLAGNADPGWYENPPGTLASAPSEHDLQRDGIDPDKAPGAEDAGV